MFTNNDFIAAHLRDAIRHANDAIERATKAGLTVEVRVAGSRVTAEVRASLTRSGPPAMQGAD